MAQRAAGVSPSPGLTTSPSRMAGMSPSPGGTASVRTQPRDYGNDQTEDLTSLSLEEITTREARTETAAIERMLEQAKAEALEASQRIGRVIKTTATKEKEFEDLAKRYDELRKKEQAEERLLAQQEEKEMADLRLKKLAAGSSPKSS